MVPPYWAADNNLNKRMIDPGVKSVMIDAYHCPFEENIERVKEVVKKSLQIDYSAASDRAYADLIGLRPTGISELHLGASPKDFSL